jgi:hypothetical protein
VSVRAHHHNRKDELRSMDRGEEPQGELDLVAENNCTRGMLTWREENLHHGHVGFNVGGNIHSIERRPTRDKRRLIGSRMVAAMAVVEMNMAVDNKLQGGEAMMSATIWRGTP